MNTSSHGAEDDDDQGIYSLEYYFNSPDKPLSLAQTIKNVLEWSGEKLPIEKEMSLEDLKKIIKKRLEEARCKKEDIPLWIQTRIKVLHMLFPVELRFQFVTRKEAGVGNVNESDTTAAV